MQLLYAHKFNLPHGPRVFVPTKETIEFGDRVIQVIAAKWSPPKYFYHFKRGGHVAAVLVHKGSSIFAKMDIEKFFDNVTRTKIVRALRRIGFSQKDAFDIAARSTVQKEVGNRGYSLPFGFPQSTLLASLALNYSALGSVLRELAREDDNFLSVYVDDIILSTKNCSRTLLLAMNRLKAGAAAAHLELNEAKTQGPSDRIEALNLAISHDRLEILSERMKVFEDVVRNGSPRQRQGVINYATSVNPYQATLLEQL